MYARQNQPTEVAGQYGSPPMTGGRQGMSNGYGGGSYDAVPASNPVKMEAAPDLLTQAFNTALKPFSDKVETLESEIMDLRAYIDQLEAQRSEVHSWIDKRGLRPGRQPTFHSEMICTVVLTLSQMSRQQSRTKWTQHHIAPPLPCLLYTSDAADE